MSTSSQNPGALAPMEPRRIEALDVSVDVLLAKLQGAWNPNEQLAIRESIALIEHPEWCSTDADYPGWTPAMGCCPAHTTPAVTA